MLRNFHLPLFNYALDSESDVDRAPSTVPAQIKRRKFMYWLFCRTRLSIASAQLRLVARCHAHLTTLIEIIYPQLPPPEDPDSEAAQEFARWTPTAHTVFAVVPPNHAIRGPGEVRKLRP